LKAADDKSTADATAAKAAADAAATKAAADLAAVDNTTYASEQAAYDAAKATAEKAASDAAAALKVTTDAALAAKTAELATANQTITALQNPAGSARTLTSSDDVFLGVAGGNDVFTGSEANIEGDADVVVDASSADSDTLNLNATTFSSKLSTSGAVIRGVENVNVAFNSLVQSTFVATGIGDASTITLSQARAGGSGDMIVQDVASNTKLVAGSGVTDLTLNTMTADRNVTIDGGAATGVVTADVSGTGTLSVTANTAATVDVSSVTGSLTVVASAATSIDAEATTGAINITNNVDSTIAADSTGNITVTAALSKSVHAASSGTSSVVNVTAE
jgi:hypothetical protein